MARILDGRGGAVMIRALTLATVLLTGCATNSPTKPYAAAAASAAFIADGASTYDAVGRGCQEGNPIFRGVGRDELLIGSVVASGLVWFYQDNLSEPLLWTLTAFKGGAAAYNTTVEC